MSKRAEEAALKAYPPTRSAGKRYAKRLQGESYDSIYEVHHAVEMADELIKTLRDGKE